MAPYYIKSKRGKNLLVSKGHLYSKHSKNKSSIYWVCIRKPECTTRCTTTEDPLRIVREGEHDHAPDPEVIASRAAVHTIKEAGVSAPERAPVHIIDQAMHRLSDGVVAKLPLRAAMKRAVNRARSSRLPTNPKSIRDLKDLPPEFMNTLSGDLFVVYDSYEEQEGSDDEDDPVEDRIIVFATKDNLKKLGRSLTWFTDGTFMVCPSLFTQLFTIHGMYRDVALPLVYALLPNKLEASYTRVLEAIKEKADELHINFPEPGTVVSDFKLAIINSVKAIFPHATLRLCFFHLGQSLWRNVQGAGLQAAYSDPEHRDLKDGVHMLLSLAFVPVEDLPAAFEELRNDLVDDLLDIADTFEKTYIQYVAAQHGEQRTNNLCEAWHRRFNSLVGKAHPTFYALLRDIRKEQATTESNIRELDLGRPVREPQRKKYRTVTERLQRIVLRYQEHKEDGTILSFLRACGYQFSL
ncbi:FLYWCH-type zinc finger-containing protein 1 [Frankliniella fusca]|uniref:FLYWCH-type zinc finger-containing protein 1 n=1 Tax=Frankliniella fusca TaxID=407009 RepID=A0AAE1LV68_9NEOP|nr:FLYWCH-type zinc finger-containing protein 1 [Frankliniella fusca]